jgi:hypothetical protein
VTDDNPFFFHFLRWSDVIFGALRGEKTVWCWPGSLTSQLMLLMMLGQALLVGGALIILPLARQGLGRLPRSTTFAFLTYFLGLGLGFLMIEISFMQKYMLVLGNPTYALSVTICSLLVSAAVGAALCRRGWGRPQRFLGMLLAATIGLVVLEGAAMPALRESLLAAPFPMRIGVTAAMQFPLGVALGMYFPTGLELLRRIEPRLIPWAWAINGVASVQRGVRGCCRVCGRHACSLGGTSRFRPDCSVRRRVRHPTLRGSFTSELSGQKATNLPAGSYCSHHGNISARGCRSDPRPS